jgi:hypothetical protein
MGGDDERALDLGVLQHGDIVGMPLKTAGRRVDHLVWASSVLRGLRGRRGLTGRLVRRRGSSRRS